MREACRTSLSRWMPRRPPSLQPGGSTPASTRATTLASEGSLEPSARVRRPTGACLPEQPRDELFLQEGPGSLQRYGRTGFRKGAVLSLGRYLEDVMTFKSGFHFQKHDKYRLS